ncbi:AEC family transporter [Pusillimonas sp. ANT_WB101]|uniref:AEC family transporter n=1 Tax=Pusillimonas sp. ANT_WB101 TaxID=2597356 RepID=UPI0011ED62A3|nr:AEC family transporter [Pusillimonas sp. ANT_WB101]KAA0891139.1 AEC family transporter [Pusillimonas sp. ANT_WB101]NYT75802.1 AEC family transporter [Alcaligenaceae bacterium]
MNAIINAVFPLFALILLGYLGARRRLLGPAAVDSLNKFVVWMALPALLFQAMAQITWQEINQPGYIAASVLSIAIVFAVSFLLDRGRGGRLADRSLEGLAASYSNTGYMGIPLCLMVFGEASLPAVVLATLLTACGLFAFSIVLIEIDLQGSPGLARTFAKVGRSVALNPLVMAPMLGLLVAASGLTLPSGVTQFTTLLGAAASPCALVTIGLFLAQGEPTTQKSAVWRIVALKLLLHPLIAFVLAYVVFDMPPMWAGTAVLVAALPVGTGPFMLAKLYDRAPATTSKAILLSTVLSLISVSALVAWLGNP